MSGLLALLDDVAAIAKLAASSVDDVTGMAAKAGSKTAGVVIDDAAVTPKYVHGLDPARELPIIWKIARASLFNKLIILLPIALLLNLYAPWLITPLLMMGGLYLCFEGAEKVIHWIAPHSDTPSTKTAPTDPAHLEASRVRGAIKTDFILSAEIMTIALTEIRDGALLQIGIALALVAIVITGAVYGVVGILVKMDDVGLSLTQKKNNKVLQSVGQVLLKTMPIILLVLSIVGTLAMLWVGGAILVHGMHELGWHMPYDYIKAFASMLSQKGALNWLATAVMDGLLGLVAGLCSIPLIMAVSQLRARHGKD